MTAGHKETKPYPGHGDPLPVEQVPRVKREGESNYNKAKGTVKQRVFDDRAPVILTPRPEPRCPSSASKDNYRLGWYGRVTSLLNGTGTPRPHTAPQPRVKPEAESTAQMGRGRRMKVIVNEYAKSGPTPRQARVKPEASGTAEISKGGRMNNLLHKYGTLPLSARAVPRVKPEAEVTAENHKGQGMHNALHLYGKAKVSPRADVRVKPEGQQNADLDKGKRMENLFHKYGRAPLSSRAVPRVKNEGEVNASLDLGHRMSRLMHEPKLSSGTPRPMPRTNTSQARENAWKGRGSMDKVFDHIARTTYVHVPGQQTKAYTRASIG